MDDVPYRWTVRPRPSYSQGLGETAMTCVVELEGAKGAALVVSLPWAHPGNWLLWPTHAVRPALVARMVRMAFAEGWDPASSGPPLRLDLPDTDELAG